MPASSTHDRNGLLCVEPVNDRCEYYLLRDRMPNLNRCACCLYFNAAARRCLNKQNKRRPARDREAPDGQPQT